MTSREHGAPENLPVEELNLAIRTYNLLKHMGRHTAGEAARLSARDVLYTGTFRWVLEELDLKLTQAGLGPLDRTRRPEPPPPPPEAPEWTFGALAVLCDDQDGLALVRQAVAEDYAVGGVRPVALDDIHERDEGGLDGGADAAPPPGGVSWNDVYDVVVTDAEAGSWLAVLSERWELAPPGRNPIALGLSRRWPVLGLTCTEGAAFELCLYREGAPVQYAAHGRPAGPPPVAAPLDFGRLAGRAWLPGVDEAELRSVFGHPTIFGSLVGLPTSGYELLQTSIHDLGELAVLFRRG